MKKTHIIGLVMVAISIALLLSITGDVNTYSNFTEATNSGDRVKIVGQLSKDKEMYYKPEEDPNYFSFYLKDEKGEERKVILHSEKPQDFEMSEQIVLTGSVKGEEFVATDILLKCPSKYKDEEIYIKTEQNQI